MIFAAKLKRFVFLLTGLTFFLSVIFFSFKLGFYIPKETVNIIWKVVISILILGVAFFAIIMCESSISGSGKTHSFLLLPISFFMTLQNKWVYHDDLGYFFATFEGEDITIYKQSFFYSKELFSVDNTGDVDKVALRIKKELDTIYSKKVTKEKENNILKEKINKMKKWDGYLDKKGRRDGKLNDILR
jgi:hypothetical protein